MSGPLRLRATNLSISFDALDEGSGQVRHVSIPIIPEASLAVELWNDVRIAYPDPLRPWESTVESYGVGELRLVAVKHGFKRATASPDATGEGGSCRHPPHACVAIGKINFIPGQSIRCEDCGDEWHPGDPPWPKWSAPATATPDDECPDCNDGILTRAFAEPHDIPCPTCNGTMRAPATATPLRSHRCIDDGGDGYECPGCHAAAAKPATATPDATGEGGE